MRAEFTRQNLLTCGRRLVGQTWAGSLATVGLGALWVGMTWWTGLTYHLQPLLIAASGPVVATVVSGPLRRQWDGWLLGLGGLGMVGEAWFLMSVGGFIPTATFVSGQPGGVVGKVVLFALVGAVAGVGYAHRARSRAGFREAAGG